MSASLVSASLRTAFLQTLSVRKCLQNNMARTKREQESVFADTFADTKCPQVSHRNFLRILSARIILPTLSVRKTTRYITKEFWEG